MSKFNLGDRVQIARDADIMPALYADVVCGKVATVAGIGRHHIFVKPDGMIGTCRVHIRFLSHHQYKVEEDNE